MTMTSDEVWDLLELIASIDRRKLGLTDRKTWQGLIGDLSADDAQAAVIAYYRESREWIMPADVRQRVKAMRADRLSRQIVPAPVTDDPAQHRAELQASISRIANGHRVPPAIGAPVREDDPPPTWAQARAKMGAPRALTPQEKALEQATESRAERAEAS